MRSFFMQTEGLGFSTWYPDDLDLAQLLWGNPEVTKYLCARGYFSQQEVNERLLKEIERNELYRVQYWPLFSLRTGDFVGCCGLRPYQLDGGIYEIGFHLLPIFWGKGLGKQAAEAVIGYAFECLGARGLFAGHHPDNAASARMLKGLGFFHTHDEYYEPTGLKHPSYRYIPDQLKIPITPDSEPA